MTDLVRLHISPFSPALLPLIVPPSLLPTVQNVSYHTLLNYPERPFGYLELPAMEASKIKKKLNGAILKGSKVKIEEAKPKKGTGPGEIVEPELVQRESSVPSEKKSRKRNREEGIISGYELPKERKVKRGWTEPVAATKERKSKKTKEPIPKDKEKKKTKRKPQPSTYTSHPECLFNTQVPLNAVDMAEAGKKQKKLGKGKGERDVVVHEFANTTKQASFLREEKVGKGMAVKEYVEGKGWVNDKGEVVEPEPQTTSRRVTRSKAVEVSEAPSSTIAKLRLTEKDEDETSSSGESSRSENAEYSSDDSKDDDESEDENTSMHDEKVNYTEHMDSKPADTESQEDKVPHPLEALYKKPKATSESASTPRKPKLELKIPFSFFGDDPDMDGENQDSVSALRSEKVVNGNTTIISMPQTPFTQRDMQFRGIRSAAPTPDTAAPNKLLFGPGWGTASDLASDEEDQSNMDSMQDDEEATPAASAEKLATSEDKPPQSDFQKWFWEHRGDTNRAWKKRKREAGKEKRQSEKKRRDRRAA
jgi:hypothetical protein